MGLLVTAADYAPMSASIPGTWNGCRPSGVIRFSVPPEGIASRALKARFINAFSSRFVGMPGLMYPSYGN
jgi:hypothetical protein